MNQVIILGFTRTSGDVDPASVAQAPMRLPQHRDSAIRSSQEGWSWSSTATLCSPTFGWTTLHM
jgi:hypothetical protein